MGGFTDIPGHLLLQSLYWHIFPFDLGSLAIYIREVHYPKEQCLCWPSPIRHIPCKTYGSCTSPPFVVDLISLNRKIIKRVSPISGLSWGLVKTMVGLISCLTKPRTRGESLLGFEPVAVFVGKLGIPLQLSDLLNPRCCKASATAI